MMDEIKIEDVKRLESEIARLREDLSMHQGFEQEWMQMARERGRLLSRAADAIWELNADASAQQWIVNLVRELRKAAE